MEKILSDSLSKIKGMAKIAEPVNGINDISRVSEGTFVKGEITSTNDIRIDGKVEGKILTQSRVVIGEHAEIKGTIVCSVLDLWGKVEGEIFVKDILSLKSSAVVLGNINVRKFQVELGARVNGNFKMLEEKTVPATEPASEEMTEE